MKDTIYSLMAFIREDFDSWSYGLVIFFLGALTFFNYMVDFEDSILDQYHDTFFGFFCYISLYSAVYFGAMICMIKNANIKAALKTPAFYVVVLAALVMICINKNYEILTADLSNVRGYVSYFIQKVTNQANTLIMYVISFIVLGLLIGKAKYRGFGLWNFKSDFRLYLILLLIMIPFLFYASTFDDFLRSYPRLNTRPFPVGQYLGYFVKFEPVYLMNFIGVEWFFRGFMVLAVMKYCDKRAVILIATIYCIFHFGKPMAECISSFFGGYILGMITYRTKTIWGGVIIHMGVALFMDLFALMAYI